MRTRPLTAVIGCAAAALLIVGCTSTGTATAPSARATTSAPVPAPTTAQINDQLKALQQIADRNGGNRAMGTPGYAQSVDHVEQVLKKAGYAVTRQSFTVPREDVKASGAEVTQGPEVALSPHVMSGSGSTPAAGLVLDLKTPTTSEGCQSSDWADVKNAVVLVQRGTCRFGDKAKNAQRAGAAAVLISDNTDAKRFSGQLTGGDNLPALGLTKAEGAGLRAAMAKGPVKLRVTAVVETTTVTTENVLAELPQTVGKKVLMTGAHLDSVPAGPGINDDGSGVALVLALAVDAAQQQRAQGLRFGFWAAEELGLLGSQKYVESLSPTDREQIIGYLNFDMVASPNGILGSYGNGTLFDQLKAGVAASGAESETAQIGDASDHAPFGGAGIPYAGIFTGAGEAKTPQQAATFGGTAGQPLDPCYHQPCDNYANTQNAEAQRRLGTISAIAAGLLESARPR